MTRKQLQELRERADIQGGLTGLFYLFNGRRD